MRVGITAFLNDRSMDPVKFGIAVEERGFDSLYLPEHTHMPVRDAIPPQLVDGVEADDYRRSLDPFVTLGAIAAVTSRIRLGTGVSLVAQHDPIVLGKAIATIDWMSGGRFVLGVGFGWNRREAEHHGVNFAGRREIAAEKVACMRALWTQEEATFDGRHVHLQASYAWPKPVGPIPVLVGGGAGPRLFAAIAAWGDGWMPVGGGGIREALPRLRAAMEACGRDPNGLEILPFGTIPEPGKLDYYREIGVTEVVLRVRAADEAAMLDELDSHRAFIGS